MKHLELSVGAVDHPHRGPALMRLVALVAGYSVPDEFPGHSQAPAVVEK